MRKEKKEDNRGMKRNWKENERKGHDKKGKERKRRAENENENEKKRRDRENVIAERHMRLFLARASNPVDPSSRCLSLGKNFLKKNSKRTNPVI